MLNKVTPLCLFGVFILLLAYIKLSGVTGPAHAGVDTDIFSLGKLYALAMIFINNCWFGVIINLIYLLLFFLLRFKNSNKLNLNFNFYILSLLIVIPQLVIYAKSGMYYHYLLPFTIGTSLLTIYPLTELRKFSEYFIILTVLLVGLIFRHIAHTQIYFNDLASNLDGVQSMVQDIRACTDIDQDVQMIVFGNPYVHFEKLDAYKNGIVDNVFSKENIKINVFLATYGSLNSTLTSSVFKTEEKQWLSLETSMVEDGYDNKMINQLTKENLKNTQSLVIFGFDRFKNDFLKLTSDWFDVNKFSFKYHSGIDVGVYCRRGGNALQNNQP